MRVVMNTSYKLVLQGLLEMQKWKHGTLLSEKKWLMGSAYKRIKTYRCGFSTDTGYSKANLCSKIVQLTLFL